MTNLRDMKGRVNSTLHTFEGVTAALNATSARLQAEQLRLVGPPATRPMSARTRLPACMQYMLGCACSSAVVDIGS